MVCLNVAYVYTVVLAGIRVHGDGKVSAAGGTSLLRVAFVMDNVGGMHDVFVLRQMEARASDKYYRVQLE